MRILFLFILLCSWFSTSLYASFEDRNECLYKGTGSTVQDVLTEEFLNLRDAVQKSAQKYSSHASLVEVSCENLVKDSFLRKKLEKYISYIQNISNQLNEDFCRKIIDINQHFASQICSCPECLVLVAKDSSLAEAKRELYMAFGQVVFDQNEQKALFLLEDVTRCLPEESLWRNFIDQDNEQADCSPFERLMVYPEVRLAMKVVEKVCNLSKALGGSEFKDVFAEDPN